MAYRRDGLNEPLPWAEAISPSEAFAAGMQRSGGHDEMQLAVMRAWKALPVWRVNPDQRLPLVFSGAEALFRSGKGRAFFADLAFKYEAGEGAGLRQAWVLLEVKPRIDQAGAIIRQVAVMAEMMRDYLWAQGMGVSPEAEVRALPVVMRNDPLAQLLTDLRGCPTPSLDGDRIVWIKPTRAAAPVVGEG